MHKDTYVKTFATALLAMAKNLKKKIKMSKQGK